MKFDIGYVLYPLGLMMGAFVTNRMIPFFAATIFLAFSLYLLILEALE